jgi:hypothetical protein
MVYTVSTDKVVCKLESVRKRLVAYFKAMSQHFLEQLMESWANLVEDSQYLCLDYNSGPSECEFVVVRST